MGQELYRLFWLDFFLEVAEVVVLDLGRAFVVRFRLLCKLSDWVSYVHVTVWNIVYIVVLIVVWLQFRSLFE